MGARRLTAVSGGAVERHAGNVLGLDECARCVNRDRVAQRVLKREALDTAATRCVRDTKRMDARPPPTSLRCDRRSRPEHRHVLRSRGNDADNAAACLSRRAPRNLERRSRGHCSRCRLHHSNVVGRWRWWWAVAAAAACRHLNARSGSDGASCVVTARLPSGEGLRVVPLMKCVVETDGTM